MDRRTISRSLLAEAMGATGWSPSGPLFVLEAQAGDRPQPGGRTWGQGFERRRSVGAHPCGAVGR
jgi:hypothetical protein